MPNIVAELLVQLARVQTLLETGPLTADQIRKAKELLRYGRDQMALNFYDGMREALDDLKDFGRPQEGPKT